MKKPASTFDRIGHAIDEMNDDQMVELLNYAQFILEDDKTAAENGNIKEETTVNNVTARALKAILDLNDEERKALLPYLSRDKKNLCNDFSDVAAKELNDCAAIQKKMIEKLKDIPTVIWAAHALHKLDFLVYDLSQIVDAAKENLYDIEDTTNATGFYKMLLNAVDIIAYKMRTILCDDDHDVNHETIMNKIAAITDDPAE